MNASRRFRVNAWFLRSLWKTTLPPRTECSACIESTNPSDQLGTEQRISADPRSVQARKPRRSPRVSVNRTDGRPVQRSCAAMMRTRLREPGYVRSQDPVRNGRCLFIALQTKARAASPCTIPSGYRVLSSLGSGSSTIDRETVLQTGCGSRHVRHASGLSPTSGHAQGRDKNVPPSQSSKRAGETSKPEHRPGRPRII